MLRINSHFAVGMMVAGAACHPVVAQPVITTQPTAQTVWSGGTASLTVAATGNGPFTYQWQRDGTNLPLAMITTVAGNGAAGYSGDGGPATNAELNEPMGLAVDTLGNIFITDRWNSRVRKVDANGIMTTVAGGGANYPGDGGPATNAIFAQPRGIAVDSFGQLFIGDWDKNVVRKVDTNGIITTVAGTGVDDCTGEGGAATNATLDSPEGVELDSSNNLLIATCNAILKVDGSGILNPATPPAFEIPTDAAVDSAGHYYVPDGGNNEVYKVDFAAQTVTLFAGGGSSGDGGPATNAGLNFPSAVKLNANGNVYISDPYDYRIRKVDTNGIITTAAGNGHSGYSGDGGAATNASLGPWGIALDNQGQLYIADAANNCIRTVAFNGLPVLVTGDPGNYSVIISNATDSVTSSVVNLTVVPRPTVTITPTNQLTWQGSTVTYTASISYNGPVSWQWQFNGSNIVGANTSALTLTNVSTPQAGYYDVIAAGPANSGTVTSGEVILDVAISPQSQTVWAGANVTLFTAVAGPGSFTYQWHENGTNLPPNVITTVAGDGTAGYSGDGGPATDAALNLTPPSYGSPCGIAVDASGNLFIPDFNNNRVQKVDTNGIISTIAGNGIAGYSGDGGPATNAELNSPSAIVLDAAGGVLIADSHNQRIRRIDSTGNISTAAGNGLEEYSGDGGYATNASLDYPLAIAMDSKGNLYIAEEGSSRVRKVDTHGIITTLAGNNYGGFYGDGGYATNAALDQPRGIAADGAGNLYIADSFNLRIRKVDVNGIITTIAGNGEAGYAEDGGAATNADMSNPIGIAVDSSGELFIADPFEEVVREIEADGVFMTVTGIGAADYFGDGGPATLAGLNAPAGIALDCAGNLFIADEGNQRIRKISADGLPTLNLHNLSTSNSHNYAVTVIAQSGSITSDIVNITVATSPMILGGVHDNDGSITLSLFSNPNNPSRILATTNLALPVQWQPIYTNIPGAAGIWQFTDTNAAGWAGRFYRLSSP